MDDALKRATWLLFEQRLANAYPSTTAIYPEETNEVVESIRIHGRKYLDSPLTTLSNHARKGKKKKTPLRSDDFPRGLYLQWVVNDLVSEIQEETQRPDLHERILAVKFLTVGGELPAELVEVLEIKGRDDLLVCKLFSSYKARVLAGNAVDATKLSNSEIGGDKLMSFENNSAAMNTPKETSESGSSVAVVTPAASESSKTDITAITLSVTPASQLVDAAIGALAKAVKDYVLDETHKLVAEKEQLQVKLADMEAKHEMVCNTMDSMLKMMQAWHRRRRVATKAHE